MAKWGEGDPRWIVEERADATNVNNWHWTEKNATGWSREKLKNLLEGLKVEETWACCEIKELTKIEGEASASNRKAKLIFFYEWEIKADWTGRLAGCDEKIKGKLEIPNLSEENDADEIDVTVSVSSASDEAYKLKELMRKKGADVIREQLEKYITDLRSEFSQGMILPGKNAPNKPTSTTAKTNAANTAKSKISQPVVSSGSSSVGVKIPCKKLTDKADFKCAASDLYRALTEKERVQAFTGGAVEMETEKGGRFSLFGGQVVGEYKELIPDKKIVQLWRFKTWPAEHYSTVTLELEQKESGTDVKLTQTGIPESDYERTKEGWRRYYWNSLKQTFGFGANLF